MLFRSSNTYTVRTDIRYVDDPYDGKAPSDTLNTDYKQARIEVSWNSPNELKPVLQIMHIAPQGIEGGEVAGTLDFQALSANGQGVAGATVRLTNATLNPAVDITTQTDDQGRVLLPGLPEAIGSWKLSVSKAQFTSERTYDTTVNFIPDTDHTHLSALRGEVTEKTFFIDQISSVAITTQDESQQPIGAVVYSLRGTKTIGMDGLSDPVYVLDEVGQTNAGGEATYDSLVWDTYDFSIDGTATGYDIKETSLLLPLVVNPGAVLDLAVTLVPHTDISLHVTVTTPGGQPIDNATVQLTDNGVDETLGTGLVGQVFFPGLPVNADYTLNVSAPSFEPGSSVVTVEDTTRVTVALTPV